MKTALVAGSTGLVGSQLLQLLLASNRYYQVKALTRSDIPLTHPKLRVIKLNFDTLTDHHAQLQADDVFCCLGTTMAKARSKDKFRKVDHEYPLALAKATLETGARQFLLVSALGADAGSSIFYNRVKGEVENDIRQLAFPGIHIFRPSLLLGLRIETRSGEDAAKFFYRAFGFLIPARYKAISSDKVARAMLHFAASEKSGTFIHESPDLQGF